MTLLRCRFEGTQAEDGLNVFGADILLDRVVFTGCRSDSFDGDFGTGQGVNCVFRDGKADGVDVSGSDIVARDNTFEHMGDKAYSIGERSKARIQGGCRLSRGPLLIAGSASTISQSQVFASPSVGVNDMPAAPTLCETSE